MFEEKLKEKYSEIAEQVNAMIPIKWEEFLLHGEAGEDGGAVYFFFKEVGKDDYIYSEEIHEIFNVDESSLDIETYKLYQLVSELKFLFIEDEQEPWFSVMIHLTAKGELNVEFDYMNWLETPFGSGARRVYFEKKYLGKEPDTEYWANELREIEEWIRVNS